MKTLENNKGSSSSHWPSSLILYERRGRHRVEIRLQRQLPVVAARLNFEAVQVAVEAVLAVDAGAHAHGELAVVVVGADVDVVADVQAVGLRGWLGRLRVQSDAVGNWQVLVFGHDH